MLCAKKTKKIDDTMMLHCLTMIDPVTGWFKITDIQNKHMYEVANTLERTATCG